MLSPIAMSAQSMLALSRAIDAITERVGRVVYWLVLIVVLISASNAIVRKLFNYSSNAYLEIQWYLFSVIFLFGAGYTLLRNEHVRIDIIAGRLSARAQNWIDVVGIVLFLWPMSFVIMWMSWPLFVDSLTRHEVSTNAGGLVIWPARLMPALVLHARVPCPQHGAVRRRERLDQIEDRMPQTCLHVGALLVVRCVLLRKLRKDRFDSRVHTQ